MNLKPVESAPVSNPAQQSPSGRWVVFTMFGFASAMILLLWGYWELYTRPFRPLQYAIAREYPDSLPAVIGGKHKSHKEGNPRVLRVVVRVLPEEFDPATDEGRREIRACNLYRLARDQFTVDGYDEFEVRLIQRVPEQEWLKWSVTRPLSEWAELAPGALEAESPAGGGDAQ